MNIIQKIIISACLIWFTQTVLAEDVNEIHGAVVGDGSIMPMPMMHGGPDFSMGKGGLMLLQLTPPMVIMRHQEELGLTEDQINTLKSEMKTFQSEIVDVQWDLHAAKTSLEKDFDVEKIELKGAMQSIDKVLDAENRLKRQHLTLLIKIHNVLTAEQQEMLKTLSPMHMNSMHMRRSHFSPMKSPRKP